MNTHDLALIVAAAAISSVVVVALMRYMVDKVYDEGRAAGYEEGYFTRERAHRIREEKKKRDAAGQFISAP